MPMKKGSEEAERASKFAASSRLQFLSFKDGDEQFVRFLTPHTDWPVVQVHIAIPTKSKPVKLKAETKWPDKMGSTCANDGLFVPVEPEPGQEPVFEDGYGHCYIHENYKTQVNQWNRPLSNSTASTFALVVLRERQGKFIKDVMEEWEAPDGTKKLVPAIRVISQPWRSFFSQVHAGAVEDEDVRTKDFLIKKDGKDFKISPMSITQAHHPEVSDNPVLGTAEATPSWKFYDDTILLLGEGADLVKLIRHQGSEEWMKLWFWPGPWDEKSDDDTEADNAGTNVASSAGAGGTSDLTEEQQAELDAYAARLRSGKATASA